ncbi:MAG: murein biosynthesis integral membrane protein MurJ [Thermoanaerobaculales bacterium]
MTGPRIRDPSPLLEPARLADALSTTGLTLVGKSAGFLVPFFIASWFGLSAGTDAFFFVYGAVLFLAGVFGPMLEVVVPFVAESRGEDASLGRFMSRLLATATIAQLAALVVFLLALVPALPLVTRFDRNGLALVIRLLVETSPLAVLLLWTSVLSGYLNARKSFAVPAMAPGVRAVVNVGCILLLKGSFGVHALPLGYIAGEAARLLVLGLTVWRCAPFQFRPAFRVDARLAGFYRTSVYPISAMVWTLINPVVDSAMASWLAPGSVTVLRYAENLYMIPFSLFTGGLVTVLLAHWSEQYHGAGRAGFERDVNRSAKSVLWLAIPVAGVLILASRPIASLLLAHGSFDRAKLGDVATAWACYLAGFPAQAMAQLQVKALFILKRTKAVMTCALCIAPFNIILDLTLMRIFGVAGIALATAGTSVATALFLARGLKAAFAETGLEKGGSR